ncbi:MAG: hypothetical protein ACTS74_03410 [Arsenophonus sp. ET-YP4-MAG3]
MKSIILLPIISIVINFIINPAYALTFGNCSIIISPVYADYGNITSISLYDEAEKNNEGFILTRDAILEIFCVNKKKIKINLRSSKINKKYFNVGHNIKVSVIIDKIQTYLPNKKYVIFMIKRGENKTDTRIDKEWFPMEMLESNKALTKLTLYVKIKLLIPYDIFNNNEAPLDFKEILNFLVH